MRLLALTMGLVACSPTTATPTDASRPPADSMVPAFDAGMTNWDVGPQPDVGPRPDVGSADGGDQDAAMMTWPDYLPFAVGNSWQYRVTSLPDMSVGTKVQTILRVEQRADLGGEVFILESAKPSGRRTVSVQAVRGLDRVRYEEESLFANGQVAGREVYRPEKLRVPNDLQVGQLRTTTYEEDQYDGSGQLIQTIVKNEQWLFVGVETVTVPAGTFETMRLARRNLDTFKEKTYWFADGVGKIREQSAGQIEELEAY